MCARRWSRWEQRGIDNIAQGLPVFAAGFYAEIIDTEFALAKHRHELAGWKGTDRFTVAMNVIRVHANASDESAVLREFEVAAFQTSWIEHEEFSAAEQSQKWLMTAGRDAGWQERAFVMRGPIRAAEPRHFQRAL